MVAGTARNQPLHRCGRQRRPTSGRVRSTNPVTLLVWPRCADGRWNAVSASPRWLTSPMDRGRRRGDVRGSPQRSSRTPTPTPKSRPTAATASPSSPIRRHISAPARSVSDARGAIASWSSVHVHLEHSASRHRQIRVAQISTDGRPAISRSRTCARRRSCIDAITPRLRQPARSSVVSIVIVTSTPTSMSVITMPCNPNNALALLPSIIPCLSSRSCGKPQDLRGHGTSTVDAQEPEHHA